MSTAITEQKLRKDFRRVVRRTQAAIFFERLWPRIVAPVAVGGIFVSASWFGLWSALPPYGRMAGGILFAAAALAAPFLVRSGSLIVREAEAIKRIDLETGDKSRPAQTLNDTLSMTGDATTQAIWRTHLTRIWDKWGNNFPAGKPRSKLHTHDPYALRSLVYFSLFLSAAFGNPGISSITKAFDYTVPPPVPEKPVIDAWVTQPSYIRNLQPTRYLEAKDQSPLPEIKTAAPGETHTAPETVADPAPPVILEFDEKTTLHILSRSGAVPINRDAGTIPDPKIMGGEKDNPDVKPTAKYEIELMPGEKCIAVTNGPRWCFSIKANKAPEVRLDGVQESKDRSGALDIACEALDDHGVDSIDVVIETVAPLPPDAAPLDGVAPDALNVPGRACAEKAPMP